jgi:hypothetical protein
LALVQLSNLFGVLAEIEEYAKWLGMDMNEDADLMWIARDALKTPLPNDWKAWYDDVLFIRPSTYPVILVARASSLETCITLTNSPSRAHGTIHAMSITNSCMPMRNVRN